MKELIQLGRQCRLITWLVICLSDVAQASIRIMKDQEMNDVFPPPVFKPSSSIPEGHLRPLGWQRRTDGPILEASDMPGTREFYVKYVSKDQPVVFRRAITQAPAFISWYDDQYLAVTYGQYNISTQTMVGRKQNKIESKNKAKTFRKFLYDYMYDPIYLASVLPRGMMSELPLPKCVRCGTISEKLVSAQLWMSSGGTSSKLHSHDEHLLQCVLFGRSDFILIEQVYKRAFDYVDDYKDSLGGHSDLDMERINAFKYKEVHRTPWRWSTLFPGDCIFIPAGYLHQVRYYAKSVAVTIEFFRLSDFDDTGCELIEKEFVPLSEAYYLLAFENGRLRLSDMKLDVNEVRSILLSLTNQQDVLSVDKFEHFYREVLGEDNALVPNSRTVFRLMKSTDAITKSEILELKSETLQKIANVFNEAYSKFRKEEENTEKEDMDDKDKIKHDEF